MIDLYKAIPEKEVTLIHNYISMNCTYPTCSIEYLLREWNEQKQDLFSLLGGKLILEKEISFKSSEDELRRDVCNKLTFYGNNANSFLINFREFIYVTSDKYRNLYREKGYYFNDLYYGCLDLTLPETLASNVYHGSTFVALKDDKKIKIENGMKAIKALQKLADLYDIGGFEEFRITHSQILNQKTLTGTLCLSIHPLDYMTMSDNNCGWSSCMSWNNRGDYRLGTVEMMNSNCVVVAYLKSKDEWKPVYNNDTAWNSKKWRCLFVVNNELIAQVKQYPYENDEISKSVMTWLKELAKENNNWEYYPEMVGITNSNESSDPTFLPQINEENPDFKFYFSTDAMYCDIYDTHNAYVAYDIPHSVYVDYSGKAECMECGALINEIGSYSAPSSLQLSCCDKGVYCVCCEEYFDEEDAFFIGDEYVCPHCYENSTSACECCGERAFDSDMRNITIVCDNKTITDVEPIYVCYDCFENNYKHRVKSNTDNTAWWLNYTYYLEVVDMTLQEINDLTIYSYSADPGDIRAELIEIWKEAHNTLDEDKIA